MSEKIMVILIDKTQHFLVDVDNQFWIEWDEYRQSWIITNVHNGNVTPTTQEVVNEFFANDLVTLHYLKYKAKVLNATEHLGKEEYRKDLVRIQNEERQVYGS